MKEWQIFFEVGGLVSPKEGAKFDDKILFKRARKPGKEYEESDDLSTVFFRIERDTEPDLKDDTEVRSKLQEILWFYGLIAGRYAETPYQCSQTVIDASNTFGKPSRVGSITGSVVLTKEQMERYTFLLKTAMQMFQKYERTLKEKSKRYLRNAIVYYYRALKDLEHFHLEEALIDQMISLESLLSKERMELGYRLSLRASSLLSVEKRDKQYDTYRRVHNLYNKRGKIVHGEEANLTYDELQDLGKYIQDAIFRVLRLNMSKKNLVDSLDKSILNEETRKELVELLSRPVLD